MVEFYARLYDNRDNPVQCLLQPQGAKSSLMRLQRAGRILFAGNMHGVNGAGFPARNRNFSADNIG
ncbi:hypothetical protein NGUA15_03636 [Salmonella enterica]|nr:hypothetical protein NGUA15_03636 [Salmonella enterica]